MILLPMHIVAGSIAIAAGYVALSAAKGDTIHKKSGMIFVYAMLLMSASGALMAMLKLNRGNVMGGTLTFYMVATALLTTRRDVARIEWLDRAALLVGLGAGLAGYTFGLLAVVSPTGRLDGYPPPLFFVFGTIALVSAAGDVRMLMRRGLQSRQRIARHVWRMCFAMFIASGSFFLGQAKVIPKPIRIFPILTTLALIPVAAMLYWVVRVKFTGWLVRRDRSATRRMHAARARIVQPLGSES